MTESSWWSHLLFDIVKWYQTRPIITHRIVSSCTKFMVIVHPIIVYLPTAREYLRIKQQNFLYKQYCHTGTCFLYLIIYCDIAERSILQYLHKIICNARHKNNIVLYNIRRCDHKTQYYLILTCSFNII